MPKPNKRQTEEQRALDALAVRSAAAFLLAALCVYPLYIDKFSNLGVTKYTGVFTLFLVFCLWLGCCRAIGAKPCAGRFARRDGTLWSLAAFAAASALSTACSLSPAASLWGLGSYYGGLTMVLFTAAGYLCLRAYAGARLVPGLCVGAGVTTTIVTVLYVLNVFNIDLIGAYADTAVVERAQFFSTLGQKDFNASYLAVTLPLVLCAFLTARGRGRTLLFGAFVFVGGLALAVVDSEGLALGLGAAGAVLVWQRSFGTHRLRRLALAGAGFFFWAGVMQYLRENVYTQGGTPLLASLGHVAQAGFALCLALWAALRFGVKRDVPLYKPARILVAVGAAGGALLVLLANLWPGFPGLGRLDEVLIFNDDWGTGRGLAWRIAWCTWADGSLWRRLVGVGPGMMHKAVASWAGDGLTAIMRTFYAAHNEYLEQLLTTGVLGLAAWLWFIASHLRRAARNREHPGTQAVVLALVSYLAHAAVSIRVSMVFPEVMLLFALLAALCKPEQAPAAPPKGKPEQTPAAPPVLGRARDWCAPAAAAAAAMAVCGALSRVLFAFLL